MKIAKISSLKHYIRWAQRERLLALYFYVKCKYFRYLLLSKCFFGMNFKFWFNPNKDIFQFIIIKGYGAMHGAKVEFSFSNLYKELKRLLNNVSNENH